MEVAAPDEALVMHVWCQNMVIKNKEASYVPLACSRLCDCGESELLV